jgi:hypothetical protein
MIKLYVTEGKNHDPVKFYMNSVRIFLNEDYGYGFWVDEDVLFDLLDTEQKRVYLSGNSEEARRYSVTKVTAGWLVSKGRSPYNKTHLFSQIESS